MSDLRASRLADLWSRHLTGQTLSTEETDQLIDAFNADEMFRRRVVNDRQLDGALRVIGDLRAHEREMLSTMEQLVRAATLSDGFVDRLRPRLQREPTPRQVWARRATIAGLACAAVITAAFVGFRHKPARPLASRAAPPAPQAMARSISRAPADRKVVASSGRRAILLLGTDDSDVPRTRRDRTADDVLQARLEQLGFDVDVLTAEVPEAELHKELARAVVVVLSPSIYTGDLTDELVSSPVPLVALESSAFSRLGLTGNAWKRDLGNIGGKTRDVVISNPGHPLAAGLTGEPTVIKNGQVLRWGVPSEEAIVIAHYPHEPAQESAIFAYERGSHMPNGDAPARRVALFIGNARVITTLTPDGWRLFDAAVNWSAADKR